MAYALDGIRVIDVTQYQLGPYATTIMADMGAEVIKVERPDKGDAARSLGPWGPQGTSAFFEANDRNKKSITVDIKSEKGREIVQLLHDEAIVIPLWEHKDARILQPYVKTTQPDLYTNSLFLDSRLPQSFWLDK